MRAIPIAFNQRPDCRVQEPIQQRCSYRWIAGELAPCTEIAVAGHYPRATLVADVGSLAEQVTALTCLQRLWGANFNIYTGFTEFR